MPIASLRFAMTRRTHRLLRPFGGQVHIRLGERHVRHLASHAGERNRQGWDASWEEHELARVAHAAPHRARTRDAYLAGVAEVDVEVVAWPWAKET
jgi:hypothetical protein